MGSAQRGSNERIDEAHAAVRATPVVVVVEVVVEVVVVVWRAVAGGFDKRGCRMIKTYAVISFTANGIQIYNVNSAQNAILLADDAPWRMSWWKTGNNRQRAPIIFRVTPETTVQRTSCDNQGEKDEH